MSNFITVGSLDVALACRNVLSFGGAVVVSTAANLAIQAIVRKCLTIEPNSQRQKNLNIAAGVGGSIVSICMLYTLGVTRIAYRILFELALPPIAMFVLTRYTPLNRIPLSIRISAVALTSIPLFGAVFGGMHVLRPFATNCLSNILSAKIRKENGFRDVKDFWSNLIWLAGGSSATSENARIS